MLAKVSRDRAPLSVYTYCHDPQRLEIAKGPDNAPDDLGRLPASAELHESSELLAPSTFAHGYLVRGLLPPYWPGAGGGEVPSRLLRRPVIDARHVRARPRTHGATRHPLREDGCGDRTHGHGHGDRAARPRRDLFDQLLRAVPCGPPVRHARSDDRWARSLECRYVAQRRRSSEHGPRAGDRA